MSPRETLTSDDRASDESEAALPVSAVPGDGPTPNWADLVTRIQSGDQAALEELYTIFGRGIRYSLLRNLGPVDLDDRVHDCFVIVTQAIRKGDLREPERLMGYVRTVVKRHVAASIDTAVHQRRSRAEFEDSLFTISDWRDDPERETLSRQRVEIARKVLQGIPRRDREILNRFYVLEQSHEQICEEMGLSYNQFRLIKSRAKARFGELGRRMADGKGGISKKAQKKSEKFHLSAHFLVIRSKVLDSTRHGTEEQLELYALGRLNDSESAFLEEHLMCCGDCLERLETAEEFALSMREASRMEPPPVPVQKENLWWHWLTRPAFLLPAGVAMLAVAAFLFSYNRVPLAPVASLQLTALRGEMASAPPANEIDITLTDAPRQGGPFRLEVVDAVGKQLWTGEGTSGQIHRQFASGVYFVRLYAADGKEAREYGFKIRDGQVSR